MEEILDRGTVRRCCKIERNRSGLYDLQITDEHGLLALDVKSITLVRAAKILEENMGSGRVSA